MPRPRFERLDPEKKDAILNSALEAFAAHGLEAASYNQIIEQAGISKGAMYYYFDDKEDLFITVVRREIEAISETVQDFPPVGTVEEFWSLLHDFLHRFMEFAASRPLAMGLMRQLFRMKKEGMRSPGLAELQELGRQFTRQFLGLGRSVGAVRTDLPDDLLVALIAAVDDAGDAYVVEHFEEFDTDEFHQWGEVFMDLVRRMVAPRVIFSDGKA